MPQDDPLHEAEPEAPTQTRPTRNAARALTKALFAVLVVAFGVAYVRSHWSALADVATGANPGYGLAAFGLAIAAQIAAMLGFSVLLEAETEASISKTDTARAFYLTQLGKYIPGSIWPVVAMAGAVTRLGLRRAAGVRALVLSLAVSTASGLVLGGSLVLFAVLRPALWWLPTIGLLALVWVVARPDTALDLFRPVLRTFLPARLSRSGLRRALLWSLVTWLMLGLQCWLLVVALGGPTWDSLIPATGGFALAYAIGVVILVAPSGLGIREGVLAVVLVATLGGSFDHDRAVVLVLASRVLLVLVDFAVAGAIIPIAYRARRVASRA